MQSETIAALAAALAAFQGQVHGAAKNASNPHLKNKYADLSSIWDAIREPLAANGLSVVQLPMPSDDSRLHLQTRLLHSSGEWMASTIVMPIGKQDPQGYGSALTYARRYGLAAMLGITQEDDDGDRAVRGPAAERKPAAKPAPADPGPEARARQANRNPNGTDGFNGLVNEGQVKRLFAIARENGLKTDDVKALMVKHRMGLNGSQDPAAQPATKSLKQSEYDALCNELIPSLGKARKEGREALDSLPPREPEHEFQEEPVTL